MTNNKCKHINRENFHSNKDMKLDTQALIELTHLNGLSQINKTNLCSKTSNYSKC